MLNQIALEGFKNLQGLKNKKAPEIQRLFLKYY